ncbi:hypothetical protein [Amycolatopsis anabasis]|uniref:hypothetical protein n=1 Tax=Amycolatopsis anabasis TaxID=1840409 RepID=UPI00131E3EFA|nr:hypothetical protein [Amycolatopsis anabasis]
MADSRIRLEPLDADAHPQREIHVGWDDVLHTYYATVFDGVDADGEHIPLVERGTDIGEILEPAIALDAVRPYAEIPDDLGTTLATHRASDTATFVDLRSEARTTTREVVVGERTSMAALLGTNDYQVAGTPSTEDEHGAAVLAALLDSDNPFVSFSDIELDFVKITIAENGWERTTIHPTYPPPGGHAETYIRGDQELTIGWAWPGHDSPTYLLSPVKLDGHHHPVDSATDLTDLVQHEKPTDGTPVIEKDVDHLLTEILGEHTEDLVDNAITQIIDPHTDRRHDGENYSPDAPTDTTGNGNLDGEGDDNDEDNGLHSGLGY